MKILKENLKNLHRGHRGDTEITQRKNKELKNQSKLIIK